MFRKILIGIFVTVASFSMAIARVNINTAKEAELQSLPGITPAKAKAIIAYRSKSGNFRTIEDIKKVPGIKDALFEQIKSELAVSDVNPSASTNANADKKAKK